MTRTHISHFVDNNNDVHLTDVMIFAFRLLGKKIRSTRNYNNKTTRKHDRIASMRNGDIYFDDVLKAQHILGISYDFNMKKLDKRCTTLCLIQHLGLRDHDPKYTAPGFKVDTQTIQTAYHIVNTYWKKRLAIYTETEAQVDETEVSVNQARAKFSQVLRKYEERFGKVTICQDEYDDACKRFNEASNRLAEQKTLFSQNETQNKLSLLFSYLNAKSRALYDEVIATEKQVDFLNSLKQIKTY